VAPASGLTVLYLLPVLVVAIRRGQWLAYASAVLSSLAYNYLFVQPRGQFAIAHPQDLVDLVVLLLVAAVVSRLAAGARERAQDAAEAEAARRTRDLQRALLHAVSHDLRSPLTAITAAGSALRGELSVAERGELLKVIAGESKRLGRMVDDLLDLGRIDAGAAAPEPDWCDLGEVVGTAADGVEGAAAIKISWPPRLPLVRADAAHLERAFANLLGNAVKHSQPSGAVSVSGEVIDGRATIQVTNQGDEIDPAERELIFEPFFRGQGQRGRGSGLGLAIARGLVEANGGTVELLPAFGSVTFAVSFPVEEQPAGAAALPGEETDG